MELRARETRLKLTIIPFSLTLQDGGTPYQISLLPVHQFSLLKLVSGCICLLNIAPNFLLFLYPFVLAILLLGCSYLVFLILWCLSKKKQTSEPSVLHLESLQASAALVGYTKAEPGVKKARETPFLFFTYMEIFYTFLLPFKL